MKAANPTGFARATASAKDALATRKLSEQMEAEVRPDDAAIRAEMERQLSRATIEFQALRRSDFDGHYPEPRETEIRAFYAANAERFRLPEEATLSVILVDRPAMRDSMGASDAGFRAWEQRMRVRADSALAAIGAGARFADVASLYGGIKANITLRRDQLPDFWRGGERDVAAVFAAAPGTVLREPVQAGSAWALVRVDAVSPTHVAPLRQVAQEIRADLRSVSKMKAYEQELQPIYEAARDSLRGDGYRLRYAVADPASVIPGEPSERDLDRYHRAHLADFSSYDQATGSVIETPLAAVREEVRRRWLLERRRDLARAAAEQLREVWSRGRRDALIERSMTRVREIGPVPATSLIDSGQVGQNLAQALSARGGRTGVGMITSAGAFVVYDLREVITGYLPTLEQARPLLAPFLEERLKAEDEAAAKALFEKDPAPFQLPGTLMFTRAIVEPPPYMTVELTRDEVERYYHTHLKDYSVQELARVRHILISPTGPGAEADAAARAKAEEILKRVRAGEDFAKLAAEFSDDAETRATGGDVGVFRRGQMLEGFERAAFAMRLGDIIGPVRTEVGYHVMECLEHAAPIIHPIAEVYANVGYACAREKADRIAQQRGDEIYRKLKNVADAKAVARRLGLTIMPSEHQIGRLGRYGPELRPYILKLQTIRPGQLYPGTQWYEGLGQAITWVDSIVPSRMPSWEEVKDQAVERYRQLASQRALLSKKAELDSMFAGGWSLDSVATLWGGLERLTDATAGSSLVGMGGKSLLDSLVFGRTRAPVLESGQTSDWVEFPGGYAKLRVAQRLAPDPENLARRVELRRQLVSWRKQNEYFDRLKARYPVEILDSELRATALTEPTER
jgi:parvulin-like peptidyl-prolyl isomerase